MLEVNKTREIRLITSKNPSVDYTNSYMIDDTFYGEYDSIDKELGLKAEKNDKKLKYLQSTLTSNPSADDLVPGVQNDWRDYFEKDELNKNFAMIMEGKEYSVEKGCYTVIPKNVQHQLLNANESGEDLQFLCIVPKRGHVGF